jgi:copper chaperone CopZ
MTTTESLIEPQEITFPVTGMMCASCVRRIEKALNKLEGSLSRVLIWPPKKHTSSSTRLRRMLTHARGG